MVESKKFIVHDDDPSSIVTYIRVNTIALILILIRLSR